MLKLKNIQIWTEFEYRIKQKSPANFAELKAKNQVKKNKINVKFLYSLTQAGLPNPTS